MSRPAGPGRLHVITDETVQHRFTHQELAGLAARGGADVVQLREKGERTDADLESIVREMARAVRACGARLVVDDRVGLARIAGADGVHLGPRDAEPTVARRRLGPQALIGATANDLETARRAALGPVDYLGVGPVFGTASKRDPARPLGLDLLGEIVASVEKPVIAIGNISPERVVSVLQAGAYGVAVLSAVVCHTDPAAAAARFAEALRHFEQEHFDGSRTRRTG